MDKDQADDPEDAESIAHEILVDQGFTSSGYFGWGKADYFSVGWRRSWLFTELITWVMFPENHPRVTGENAMLITDELRMRLTSEADWAYRNEAEYYDADWFDEWMIKDIRSEFNDRRIVLFDYHY